MLETTVSACFVYTMIAMFFGLITIITLILGGGHDVSIDHDASGGHADGGDNGWSSWFSLKVISAFGTAFGAAGAIASANHLPFGITLLCAAASGFVLGALIHSVIGFLTNQEGGGTFRRDQLAGAVGTVTLTILAGGIGEVQFIVEGQMQTLPARSSDGMAIVQGTRVIVDVVGSVLQVKRA